MQYKYFVGTRRQCARRIAWWYVWGKYGSYSGSEKVKGLECFCGDSEDSSRYPWNDCPIHDHDHGYLARLARRMESFVYADFDLLILKRDSSRLEARCATAEEAGKRGECNHERPPAARLCDPVAFAGRARRLRPAGIAR